MAQHVGESSNYGDRSGPAGEIHDDHFAPDAKDEDWLVEVGKRGWIVLTKDDRRLVRE